MSSELIDEFVLAVWRAAHEEALKEVRLSFDDRRRSLQYLSTSMSAIYSVINLLVVDVLCALIWDHVC